MLVLGPFTNFPQIASVGIDEPDPELPIGGERIVTLKRQLGSGWVPGDSMGIAVPADLMRCPSPQIVYPYRLRLYESDTAPIRRDARLIPFTQRHGLESGGIGRQSGHHIGL
jgi:hypothetical protein